MELEAGAGGMLDHLGAAAPQLLHVAPGHGHEARQAQLAVAGGELGLATEGRLPRLTLARGLRLADPRPQFALRPVAGDRSLDLTRRSRAPGRPGRLRRSAPGRSRRL